MREDSPQPTPAERLGVIVRWLQREGEDLLYTPDPATSHDWVLHDVPFRGNIVGMVVAGDTLYLAVETEIEREIWSTTDGEHYTQPTPAAIMAMAWALLSRDTRNS
jgi:hypothetical protein